MTWRQRTTIDAPTGDQLRGELLDFQIRGADFWGTGRVRTQHDGGDVVIVGKVLGAKPGDTVELDGELTKHPKFGVQFKVRACRVVLPSSAAGVVGWLAAKLPQVSRRRAEQLVERYGVEALWQILDRRDAAALTVIDGITEERAEEILAAYDEHKADRDRLVRFKEWGLTDAQVARVLEEWDDEAEERITRNPYALIECVKGFGWQRADAVALRMGVRRDDPARIAAGVMHAMTEAAAAGHCYCALGKLVAIVSSKVCELSDEHAVRAQVAALVDAGRLVQIEQNIYLPRIASAECSLAKVLARAIEKGRAA